MLCLRCDEENRRVNEDGEDGAIMRAFIERYMRLEKRKLDMQDQCKRCQGPQFYGKKGFECENTTCPIFFERDGVDAAIKDLTVKIKDLEW